MCRTLANSLLGLQKSIAAVLIISAVTMLIDGPKREQIKAKRIASTANVTALVRRAAGVDCGRIGRRPPTTTEPSAVNSTHVIDDFSDEQKQQMIDEMRRRGERAFGHTKRRLCAWSVKVDAQLAELDATMQSAALSYCAYVAAAVAIAIGCMLVLVATAGTIGTCVASPSLMSTHSVLAVAECMALVPLCIVPAAAAAIGRLLAHNGTFYSCLAIGVALLVAPLVLALSAFAVQHACNEHMRQTVGGEAKEHKHRGDVETGGGRAQAQPQTSKASITASGDDGAPPPSAAAPGEPALPTAMAPKPAQAPPPPKAKSKPAEPLPPADAKQKRTDKAEADTGTGGKAKAKSPPAPVPKGGREGQWRPAAVAVDKAERTQKSDRAGDKSVEELSDFDAPPPAHGAMGHN